MSKLSLLRLMPLLTPLLLIWAILNPDWAGHSRAQSNTVISWEDPINISGPGQSPASQPHLIADPAGKAHLFWSQRFNQSFGEPDTIMYASWDGANWSTPVDIFLTVSPVLPGIAYPTAALDDQGYVHMIWLDQNWPSYTLNYSTVHSSQASNANAWKTQATLAEDASGTNYSIDLAYEVPDTLHVVFARVEQGQNPPEQRALSYIRSTDRGVTWSLPIDLYTVPDFESGVSNTRLLSDGNRLYVTWTEWDQSGNGQAVYFRRSIDSGATWEDPVLLSQTPPEDYERDWPNLVVLEDDKIAVMWEGGFRAYRHTMYSDDAGQTWSSPIDTFPGLIGENGFAEFVRDGNDTLHVFLAQRIREGNPSGLSGGLGLWHSVWEGGTQWSRPSLAKEPYDMINPTTVIVGGNQVVTAWYSSNAFEIMVMSGEIVGAPSLALQPWPALTSTPTPEAASTATPTPTILSPVANPPGENGTFPTTSPSGSASDTQLTLLIGLLPTLLLLFVVTIVLLLRKNRSWGR